jgi:glycosyltransferase involved in cell wall biosynthesis
VYQPFVSVICLCYNHVKYIDKAVHSVLHQSYRNIELIIIDDASTDGSAEKVKKIGEKHNLRTILLPENQGNCKAFNIGFSLSKGKYIIDLAADDVLLPERIEIGVKEMGKKDQSYGVHYCDIELIDKNGKILGTHFKRDSNGNLLEKVKDGDLYKILLEKYYICTPTMMMRREVLEKLGGYDEKLSYEDFDFWIRSSRNYKYCYTDRILMQKLIIKSSHSARQYQRKNPHSFSTALVCQKALKLNKDREEDRALLKRIDYELKWALITENWHAAELFLKIKKSIPHSSVRWMLESFITSIKPPWYVFWKLLIK